MTRFAFAGFRHAHINGLYTQVQQHPDAQVIAAFEEDACARDAAAQNLGVNFNKNSYAELLADPDVDVVAIGDYFAKRGSLVIQALEAGKDVVCDKPICTNIEELDRIEQLVKETGRIVMPMLDLRLTGWARTVREMIASGKLGQIHNGAFTGQHPLNYGTRPGWYFEEGKHGGTINDLAIHGIDLLPVLTGLPLEKVLFARCWNAYAEKEPNFKDCAQFMFTLQGGVGIQADVSYSSPNSHVFSLPQYWRFTLWGTKGMVEFGENSPVRAYIDGESEAWLPEVSTENIPNLLECFLALKRGEETWIDMQQAFAASRFALTAQEFADKN